MAIHNIIWDLGGVLIDWDPRYLYRKLFDAEEKVEWFLREVCTPDWNEQQDAGYPISLAVEEKCRAFPAWETEIRVYYDRWPEMLRGPIPETVALFRHWKESTALRHFALTNWSAELFPIALQRFDFLHWFHGRVVSGEEKTRKPFTDIFLRLFDRYAVHPSVSIFIDDNLRNVEAATALGLRSIHFRNADQLKQALEPLILPGHS